MKSGFFLISMIIPTIWGLFLGDEKSHKNKQKRKSPRNKHPKWGIMESRFMAQPDNRKYDERNQCRLSLKPDGRIILLRGQDSSMDRGWSRVEQRKNIIDHENIVPPASNLLSGFLLSWATDGKILQKIETPSSGFSPIRNSITNYVPNGSVKERRK